MEKDYPFHVQLHLTDRCNLKCKHCYEGERQHIDEWNYDELSLVIKKLDETFVKWNVEGEISLVGGEPLLYPYIPQLLYDIRKTESISRIAILTNGTVMTEDIKSAILDTTPAVQISIDGINEEKHDYIRGKGNYKKAIDSIKWYVNNGIDVFVHYVISKNSIPITKEFIMYMNSLGVKQMTFSRVVPLGSSDESVMLSSSDLHVIFDNLNDYAEQLPKSGMTINTTRPLWACYGKTGRCPVGIQTITILPNGTVLPCRRLPIPVGNIKEQSLFEIWYKSDVLWNLRSREKLKKCGNCKYLNDCGGARCIAYAVSGDYMGVDPQCWI